MASFNSLKFDSETAEKLKGITHYDKQVGENWPVVYILSNNKEAYVGETHHASIRMSQHWLNPQRRSLEDMMLISGKNFNKSVVLDLESFLIKHMSADGKFRLQNGNGGLQDHDYYNRPFYEEIFVNIWRELKSKGLVEHTIDEIENSTLYKYSPYKSLGEEQLEAQRDILKTFIDHTDDDQGVTVLVRGGAGTGKTILAVYLMKLFADISSRLEMEITHDDYSDGDIDMQRAAAKINGINKIGIVFPQATLKSSIMDVFGSVRDLYKSMVYSTTEVVDEYLRSGEKFDLLIVDEAHRLKCRYRGHLSSYPKFDSCTQALGFPKERGNELDWLMTCSRNQIIFRDELQTVRPCDIDADDFRSILHNRREKYDEQVIELNLETQWRCEGGNDYIEYIKGILSGSASRKRRFDNYDFRLYKDVDRMIEAVRKKDAELGLCRNAAGYAWRWISKRNKKAYDIEIQGHQYRWNSTYNNWIASKNAVNEIGCIHTLQGYDLNYVGLIIGEDIKYDKETGKIYADKDHYFDQQGKSGVANDPEALKEYLLNIYLTLMTRGIKGTYLYVCDDDLREYFKRFVDVAE